MRGKSAIRHFTSDFIGARTTPIVASVTLFSCYTKAFRLNSVIKNNFADLQRNVSDYLQHSKYVL